MKIVFRLNEKILSICCLQKASKSRGLKNNKKRREKVRPQKNIEGASLNSSKKFFSEKKHCQRHDTLNGKPKGSTP